MKQTLRKWLLNAVTVSLLAIGGTALAQNTEPAAPPAPPAPPAVEAPDVPTPDVERADTDAQTAADDADTDAEDSNEDRRRGPSWHRRHDDDRVAVGNNATLDKGQHANSVVSVFGSSTSDGDVSDAVVSVLGNTRVTGTTKDAIAVLGSVYLDGVARGNVVATLGNVELGPNAEVFGDVTVVGGELKRDPKAIVHGGMQNVMPVSFGSFEWLQPWFRKCLLFGRPLAIGDGLGWAWGLALGFLALYLLIAITSRDAVDRCVRTFETQPGKCILAALLTMVLTPVVFSLLFITIIGILFVPFAGLAMFLMGLFGRVVMLAWIGRCCLRVTDKGNEAHTAAAVLLGGVIVLVLYLVPVVGFIVYNALGFLGFGVVVYALILSMRKNRVPPPAAATPANGPVDGGGPSSRSEPSMSYPEPGSAGYAGASGFAGASGTANEASGGGGPQAGASPYATGSAREGTSGEIGGGATGTGWTSGEWTGPGGAAAGGTAGASASDTRPGTAEGAAPNAAGTAQTGNASSRPSGTQGPPGGSYSGPSTPFGRGPINPATAATFPKAGFGVRMAALFIDIVLVSVILGIVDGGKEAQLIALATYGAVMWKLKGTTIGGIVFGLQVVRVDGREMDWPTATVRALSCFLSLVVAGLGFIWIAFDPDHQAWHDKIAGTAVVRVPKGVSLL